MAVSPRVAILTPYSLSDYAGGIEIFNEQLSRCLPGVQIFSAPRREGRRWSLDSVGLEHPLRAWTVAREFLEHHRRRPFRMAVCNGIYGWPLAALPLDIPVIQVYHFTVAGLARKGIAEQGVRVRMRCVDGTFDRFAGAGKHVVAVGRNVLEEVRRFYRHEGRVIPNGVDVRLFAKRDRLRCRQELHLPEGARIGLFVGRPEYAKGFDILQDVIRAVPDTLFLLVGDTPERGPNVVVHRGVPHPRMPDFYSAADFLILPSRYEGFNLTILEALACDLPILVSRAAYPFEDDGRGVGVVVESQEPQAYVEALGELSGRAGDFSLREQVASKYSLERFQENWRNAAFELMGIGPGARLQDSPQFEEGL